MTAFAPGLCVLDVGCGFGRDMEGLRTAGIEAVGVDPDPEAVAYCQGKGLPVTLAPAEALPFEAASFDGVVLDGVLQFTDPEVALAEVARVLKPGGTLLLASQGAGYALYLAHARRGRGRFFGVRTILNGACYALLRRRLPGWWGDTLCFSPRQLARMCDGACLTPVQELEGPRHCGLSVFLYLRLKRKL